MLLSLNVPVATRTAVFLPNRRIDRAEKIDTRLAGTSHAGSYNSALEMLGGCR